MAKKIKHSDLFEDGLWSTEDVDKYIKAVDELKKGLKGIALETHGGLAKVDPNNLANIDKLNKGLAETLAIEKSVVALEKEEKKLKEAKIALTDKEIAQNQLNNKEKTARITAIKNETLANDKNAGSLERLGARNRALSAEQRKLNLGTLEGRKRYAEINEQLNRNNDFLKANADNLRAQKINIGNYQGALKDLKRELQTLDPKSARFAEVSAEAGKLKDTIDDTKESIKELASSSKGEQFANTFGSLKDKVLSLDFEGASDKAKQLLNITKSITFAEIKEGAKNLGSTFASLGQVLLNPFVLVTAAIGGVIFSFFKLNEVIGYENELLQKNTEYRKRNAEASAQQKLVNEALTDSLLLAQGKITESEKRRRDILREDAVERKKIIGQEVSQILANNKRINESFDAQRKFFAGATNATQAVQQAKDREELEKKRLLELEKFKLSVAKDTAERISDLNNTLSLKLKENDVNSEKSKEKINDKSNEDKLKKEAEHQKKLQAIKEHELKVDQEIQDAISKNQDAEREARIKQIEDDANDFEKTKIAADKTQDDRLKASILSTKKASHARTLAEISAIEEVRDFALLNDELTNDQRIIIAKEAQEKINALKQAERVADIQQIQNIAKIFENALDKQSQRKQSALDKEVNERDKNISAQQRLAERGLTNTLAFEKKQRDIAELEKEKQKDKDVTRAKVIAYWNAFSEYLKQDPDTASFKALAQVVIANQIAGEAYDGTEDTGGAGNMDSKGGKLWILHPHEGVVKRSENEANPGLVGAINNGNVDSWFISNMLPKLNIDRVGTQGNFESIKELKAIKDELSSLKDVVRNKRESVTYWDGHGNMITNEVEGGIKKTIAYTKKRAKI